MRAKVKATGEILNNVILGNTSCEVYTVEGVNEKGQSIIYDSTLVSLIPDSIQEGGQQSCKIDWEQRRFMVAKEIFCKGVFRPDVIDNYKGIAKMAVEYADALIVELKKEKK